MIQRIQTIWLFLAALLSGLLLLNWYTGYVYKADVPEGFGATVKHLTVTEHFPSVILAVVMIAMPLIAIFMFKNRKRQKRMGLVGVLACIMFISMTLWRAEDFKKNSTPQPTGGSYEAGAIIPAVVIVLIILAISGIRKDEKLVKSMDRLR
jgi:hypothetical protein